MNIREHLLRRLIGIDEIGRAWCRGRVEVEGGEGGV